MLAVHLTFEEGLKLKIAMNGGLESKSELFHVLNSWKHMLLSLSDICIFDLILLKKTDLSAPVTLCPPTILSSPFLKTKITN